MSEKTMESNTVNVIGEVVSGFTFSHMLSEESFYLVKLAVNRLSDQVDVLPIMISEHLINVERDLRGCVLEVSGQFRSYNHYEGSRNRLLLSVFAREVNFLDTRPDASKTNQIFLNGYICKEPIDRRTPLGREIADILLAVNRPYGKSDYIPCIAWGRNAKYAAGLGVGSRICIWGRIQSREYTKKLSETDCEKRVAYEVSIGRLENGKDIEMKEKGEDQ